MKKKIMIAMCVLLVIVALTPILVQLKDGGTVKYQAILYTISDVHRLDSSEATGYKDGVIVEILGMEIFRNVD